MKRPITIFILFAYMLFNAGISISMHYCGDQLTSSAFLAANKGCACGTQDKDSNDCCKDVQIESGQNDQKTTNLYKINFEKVVLSEINFYIIELNKLYKDAFSSSFLDYHSPPYFKVHKYLFNQIFRL